MGIETLLNELTPESIAYGVFPVKELLCNSVYYPASAFDGGVIRDCNVNRKDWNVLSFIYCDYNMTKSGLQETDMPRGYRIFGQRQLTEHDLVPKGWTPKLPPNLDMQSYQYSVSQFANKRPFATWMVFERLPEFDKTHGPKRFSLLFICGDGVATYQALYWTHKLSPRAIAIIQPGTGFGFNWTDFYKRSDPFYWTVSHNPAGMPEYVYCGHWSEHATAKAANLEYMDFDWPEYKFIEPAVGYPQHEVIILRHKGLKN